MTCRRSGLVLLVCVGLVGLLGFDVPDAHAGKSSDGRSPFQIMDTNSDGKVSEDEHAAGARKMFETMDANKDGNVTATEMEAAQEQLTGKTPGKTKATEISAADKIKVIDTDGDGTLSAEEHASGSRTMFGKMDTNKDGLLTKAEMDAGHAKMMSRTAHK